MIENIIKALGGIQGFGEISILLFIAVFGGALVWAFFQEKSFLRSMESMPLEDEQNDSKAESKHE